MRGGLFKNVWADRRGVSAVEFALIAPIMIAFYFGMCEMAQAFMTQKRMGHVASTIADLAAQDDVLLPAEINDLFAAGQTIMRPYSTTPLAQRLNGVTVNSSGQARVVWSRGAGMTARSVGSTVTLPSGIAANGESVVMSEVTYQFTSPITAFLAQPVNFTRTYYLRPRRGNAVTVG